MHLEVVNAVIADLLKRRKNVVPVDRAGKRRLMLIGKGVVIV